MANGQLIFDLIREANAILDAGCGARGGHWWPRLSSDQQLVAVDLLEKPEHLPANARFYMTDIVSFCQNAEFQGYFDLAVADHVFEHVSDPVAMAYGLNQVLKPSGIVHVGIPDATFFTDRFYHLVYPDGGGHISKLGLESMCHIMRNAGFEEVKHETWADDWRWFKEFFDWQGRCLQYVKQEDIDYIADTFVKELTPEKGYFYGWEIVFTKREGSVDRGPIPSRNPAVPRVEPLRALWWKYVPARIRHLAKRAIWDKQGGAKRQ
jgi:predicted SAM-dependent methyltransferase